MLMIDMYVRWVQALTAMTSTPEDSASYRRIRTKVVTEIAKSIVAAATPAAVGPHLAPTFAPAVIYGVYLDRHPLDRPVYIGQTLDPTRRLWDLAIGESHHLANTFPPEIWQKVVVVRWTDLMRERPYGAHLSDYPLQSIGLGLEYALQLEFSPLINMWKKERTGELRQLSLTKSASVGKSAQAYPGLSRLAADLVQIWRQMSNEPTSDLEWIHLEFGGIAFPSRCYKRLTESSILLS
jgi:hypothetical protein